MAINTKSEKIKQSLDSIFNQSFDEENQVLVFEALGTTGQYLARMKASDLTTLLDFDGGTNPVYIGQAASGTASSAAFWQIRKITYDGSGNPTTIAYAGGTTNFNQIYDNRASLSYS